MKLHVLKIERSYYIEVMGLNKKAELRINDRNFKLGDIVHFTDTDGEEYEGTFSLFKITHILEVSEVTNLPTAYVMLSIEPVEL